MSFYQSISSYYDRIFTADPETVQFLASRLEAGSKVLDLACGTGNHALALARLGYRVTGLDLDAAMIALAEGKKETLAVTFKVADMLSIKKTVPGAYGLIFCIGNSLVHLASEEAVAQLLGDCVQLLTGNGRLVIQIINYDRVLKEHIVVLPPIKDKESGLLFTRRYDYTGEGNRLHFNTVLTVQEGGKKKRVENSIPLLILKSARLVELAKNAGLREIALFGDFQGAPYSPDSHLTILRGRK